MGNTCSVCACHKQIKEELIEYRNITLKDYELLHIETIIYIQGQIRKFLKSRESRLPYKKPGTIKEIIINTNPVLASTTQAKGDPRQIDDCSLISSNSQTNNLINTISPTSFSVGDHRLQIPKLQTKNIKTTPGKQGSQGTWGRFVYDFVLVNSDIRYTGYLCNAACSGFGIGSLPNGVQYKGEWYNNLPNGYGVISFPNGEYYEGDIVDFRVDGIGIWYGASTTFSGEWKHDIRHGIGTEVNTSNSDEYYQGTFIEGKRNGFGIYQWERNELYKGCFLDGAMHGYGKYHSKDGVTYEGTFKNNRKEGKGSLIWKDQTVFYGNYSNGLKHGLGQLTYSNGCKLIGCWNRGRWEGLGKFIRKNKEEEYYYWDNGIKRKWLSPEVKELMNDNSNGYDPIIKFA